MVQGSTILSVWDETGQADTSIMGKVEVHMADALRTMVHSLIWTNYPIFNLDYVLSMMILRSHESKMSMLQKHSKLQASFGPIAPPTPMTKCWSRTFCPFQPLNCIYSPSNNKLVFMFKCIVACFWKKYVLELGSLWNWALLPNPRYTHIACSW